MRNNRLVVNIMIVIMTIVYVFLVVIGNVDTVEISMAVVEGSYGESYAKNNDLNRVSLADSEEIYFDLRYEKFDYNVVDGEVIIEGYDGISDSLVIPEEIEGLKVTTLGESFFDSISDVKEVYVPSDMELLEPEEPYEVIIYCDENGALYEKYKNAGWNLETKWDSQFVNYYLESIPYEYNEDVNSIEITSYRFDKEAEFMPGGMIVIPSHINGKPVTTISMDMAGEFNVVVVPETVTEINGETKSHVYSGMFVIETIFTIVAFVIVAVVVNVILPRYKDKKEYFLSGPQIVLSILYVVIQTVFGILGMYDIVQVHEYIALVVSGLLLITYLTLLIIANKGRSHSKKITENVTTRTEWMKKLRIATENMAGNVKDSVARKEVERLVEEIKYSDPMNDASLEVLHMRLEEVIDDLKDAINEGNTTDIISKCEIAMKVLKERNSICKANK